jgi:hypothetical protein
MSTKKSASEPEVFIVESLYRKEEDANCYDGKRLHDILCLDSARRPKYYYIRTKQELKEIARLFTESRYRWLHLSCHGDDRGLGFRLDSLSFAEFSEIFSGRLDKRRLFVSACEVGVRRFAKAVFAENPECYSVVAPAHGPVFTESAVVWSAFYHLMRQRRERAMRHQDITEVLAKLGNVFPPRMSHFEWDPESQTVTDIP